MRLSRRTLLGSGAVTVGAGLAGIAAAAGGGTGTDRGPPGSDGTTTTPAKSGDGDRSLDAAVAFARNVEEVRGHLASSVTLLETGRREEASLHASHGPDYYGPILPAVRDVDPGLATRLRARLAALEPRVRSASAADYADYVDDAVRPLLAEAETAVLADERRDSPAFGVRVANALAGRLAEEYTAAVPSAGTVELAGEYWDARGFLTRIEDRVAAVETALGGAANGPLTDLRRRVERVADSGAVRGATLSFRVATAAAVPLPAARIDDREQAVRYVRNLEEVRGHLASSVALIDAGHESAAGLHAGHGGDYVTTLLPAVRRADADLADRLGDALVAAGDRVTGESDAYETFVDGRLRPLLDRVPRLVVPNEYLGRRSFDAAVILALSARLDEEYAAAVTDDERIEKYGEYWDARGFLTRIEARYESMASSLSAETRTAVGDELSTLRTALERAAPPADVAGSVRALETALGDVAAADQ